MVIEIIAQKLHVEVLHKSGLTLIPQADSLALLQEMDKSRIRILGIERYLWDGDTICPDIDGIADFSSEKDSALSIRHATVFIQTLEHDEAAFLEFVVE